MFLRRGQVPIVIVNLVYLAIASILFFSKKNWEFIIYIGVIVFFFVLIFLTNKRVKYPNLILWGLTLWGILHISGGSVFFNSGTLRLYDLILFRISKTLPIFRYDQFVHIFGFGVATLVMYILLKPLLKKDLDRWTSLSIIIVMAGLGVGALNEVIEFIATILAPETGVGGYINTSLDLVSNLIGAVIALVYIRVKKGEIG